MTTVTEEAYERCDRMMLVTRVMGMGGGGGRRVDGIGESDSNDKVNSWRGEERLPMRDGQRDVRKWKESYSRPMDARKLR